MERENGKIKYQNVFILFMVGCVLGVILEGTFCYVRHAHWESHVTFLWGPFNIVYGLGAALMYVVAEKLKKKNIFTEFIVFALLGSAIEWVMGFIQDKMFNSYSWVYGKMPIGKYLCVPFTVAWGVLGVLFMQIAVPLLNKCFEHIKSDIWLHISTVLTVFMCVNLLFSVAVFTRWGQRAKNPEPKTAIARFIDKHYSDEYLQSRFVEWKMNGT